MYGIAYSMQFPCICFGKTAWYFKLSTKYHRFKWYSWFGSTKGVWWQRVNSYPFKFFGVMILPHEDIYDLDPCNEFFIHH